MTWRNLAFWKKVMLAFGSIVILMVLSLSMSQTSMKRVIDDTRYIQRLNRVHNHFNEKIVAPYEGLAEQEAQHKHFVKELSGMQQQVKSGNAMVTMDLMDFLKAWLITHIMGTDRKYKDFFRARGVA